MQPGSGQKVQGELKKQKDQNQCLLMPLLQNSTMAVSWKSSKIRLYRTYVQCVLQGYQFIKMVYACTPAIWIKYKHPIFVQF